MAVVVSGVAACGLGQQGARRRASGDAAVEAPAERSPRKAKAARTGEPRIRVAADGSLSPRELEIQRGETVTFELASHRDSVVRTRAPSKPGTCGEPVPWTPETLAAPSGLAPGGLYVLSPFLGEPGLEVVARGACQRGDIAAVQGDQVLCSSGPKGRLLQETLDNPAIAGIHVRLDWDQIQPGPDRYDFSAVAAELDRIVASGKRFALSVRAGKDGTPDWIFSAGVQRLGFQDAGFYLTGCGDRMDLGSPADPKYGELWNAMMREVSAFVRSRADWYRALSAVRLGGTNIHTAEIRLPNRCLPECAVCNTEVWAQSGYRPSKLYDFYDRQEEVVAAAFPERTMTYMLIHAGMPRVSEDGCWLVGEDGKAAKTGCRGGVSKGTDRLPRRTEQTEELLRRGIARYGSRFAIQHNGLASDPGPGKCPSYRQHPVQPPVRGGAEACPNTWVLEAGASAPDLFTGFQTRARLDVGSQAALDATLVNAWDNSDAVLVEIYEERAWEATRLEAAGTRGPSGLTLAEWDARFRERRTRRANPKVPDPDALVFRHTFAGGEGREEIHVANGRCTDGTGRTATIVVTH